MQSQIYSGFLFIYQHIDIITSFYMLLIATPLRLGYIYWHMTRAIAGPLMLRTPFRFSSALRSINWKDDKLSIISPNSWILISLSRARYTAPLITLYYHHFAYYFTILQLHTLYWLFITRASSIIHAIFLAYHINISIELGQYRLNCWPTMYRFKCLCYFL
jgi:hypothetical protein